jgi:hypothetical protein
VVDFADDPGSELQRKAQSLSWVCVTETITYAVLFAFWVSGNRAGTAVTGSIHGIVVLAFAAMVIMISHDMGWTWRYVGLVVLTGPIGAILVFERIRRHGVPQRARA